MKDKKLELASFVIVCPLKGKVTVPLKEARVLVYVSDIYDKIEVNFNCPCGERHSVSFMAAG